MYDDPLGYFLTWTTYGTWLPGDERGWMKWHHGYQLPDKRFRVAAKKAMVEPALTLDSRQRQVVEDTIAKHCDIRGWLLHVVNCRTNHVHVVVTAPGYDPKVVRDQFKAWCTRKLKDIERLAAVSPGQIRTHWWTEGGSERFLNDDPSLDAAIQYVLDAQDAPPEEKH